MTDLRVLVLGAGSIGSRHARNLSMLGATVFVADPDEARAAAVADATAVTLDAAIQGAYDGVVVATPTSLHHEHATMALRLAPKVLVEKPLAATAAEADDLASSAGDRVMVGYNLRCHAPVARFMQLVHTGSCGRVLHARLWFGSYLPDWRPSVDYRSTYSARADLGGGILADAIHELDLALWLLPGELTVNGAIVRRVGDLEIDVEDVALALFEHESGAAVAISLDYLSRAYRRGIEVVGTEGTARLDWATRTITVENAEGRRTEDAVADLADSYVDQAGRFLAWLRGDGKPPVGGREGARSVALADAVRHFR